MNESENWNDRTRRLVGEEALLRLEAAHVTIAGVGGVGGYAAEILARAGIGTLTLIDSDNVAPSNLNRQIIALRSTVGMPKTTLFAKRFADINPDLEIIERNVFISPDNAASLISDHPDYVIDAIDTVAPKVALIESCWNAGIPVISSMGAGGRLDPTKICYRDLWQTYDDGLAKAVRNALKKKGCQRRLTTVWSSERPERRSMIDIDLPHKRTSLGTMAAIPATFGIFLANYVIRKIMKL